MIAHERIEWLEPRALWTSADPSEPDRVRETPDAVRAPAIAKLAGDDFMDRFVAAASSETLHDLTWLKADDQGATERLYLPFHSRYHLVAASLVCARLGFPDHSVDTREGEAVGFVVRRLSGDDEQAWVPGAGWVAVDDLAGLQTATVVREVDGETLEETVEEERHPLVRLATGKRQVWYGYLPLAGAGPDAGGKKFASGNDRYVVRCVYERPACREVRLVMSPRSRQFRVSTFLDPFAPHRPVSIGIDVKRKPKKDSPTGAPAVFFELGSGATTVVRDVFCRIKDQLPGDPEETRKDMSQVTCGSLGLSIPWITICAFIALMIVTAIFSPILLLLALLPGLPCPDAPAIDCGKET